MLNLNAQCNHCTVSVFPVMVTRYSCHQGPIGQQLMRVLSIPNPTFPRSPLTKFITCLVFSIKVPWVYSNGTSFLLINYFIDCYYNYQSLPSIIVILAGWLAGWLPGWIYDSIFSLQSVIIACLIVSAFTK